MTHFYFKTDADSTVLVPFVEGESVLDALLKNGYEVPHGCRSGICQSCMMVSKDGIVPEQAQTGLTESQKKSGYFLSCCRSSDNKITVSKEIELNKYSATVIEKTILENDVVRLRVTPVFDYMPGQFATLWKDGLIARSYSIASHPRLDDYIEFHIKRYINGAFSNWAYHNLKAGDEIQVQAPRGDCVYHSQNKQQTLFLAGIGTGLAPLYGILRDAIHNGHTGDIDLIVAAKDEAGFYMRNELNSLQLKHEKLNIHFICQTETNVKDLMSGDVYQLTETYFPSFKNVRVFLCGAGSFVSKMKKQCFLAGANMSDIFADSFL